MTSHRAAKDRGKGKSARPARGAVQRRRGLPRSQAQMPPEDAGAMDVANLVDHRAHRCPWPAGAAERRYSVETPILAVVNARGPWACWHHKSANPPYIALYLGLLDKEFWRRADNSQRVFALTVWMQMAKLDFWGRTWGDPVRLCYEWRLDAATFSKRLAWMIGNGLACYLTHAEADAVPRCPQPPRSRERERGGEKPEGGGGESGKGGEREQAESRQDKQGKVKQDKAEPVQVSDPPARTRLVSGYSAQGQEQAEQAKQAKQAEPSKSQQSRQGTAQGQEPANLPKSDHGAARDQPHATGHARSLRTRPRSVPAVRGGDAVRLGEILGWDHPAAVSFGRRMYEAIKGVKAPPDLTAAHDADKGDVGVWVKFWAKHVRSSLASDQYQAFEDRCFGDVVKKRKVRSIRNLGKVARAKIVPGVLSAMINRAKSG